MFLPSTIPYASGHGSLVTVPSGAVVDLQVPSAYMALKILSMGTVVRRLIHQGTRSIQKLTAFAVLSVAKLVPTTLMRPVPR